MSFRRGGLLELDLDWAGPAPGSDTCLALLEGAGFQTEEALAEMEKGMVTLTQRQNGVPIVNCRLTAQTQNGVLQIRGRWLLPGELTAGSGSMSRAQMALALCDLLEQRGSPVPGDLSFGYFLQSEDASSLTLVPVWVISLEGEQLLLSCLTGETVLY